MRFESVWFLPPDSFLVQWFEAKESLFPSEGELVTVYMTDLDYPSEMGKIEGLVSLYIYVCVCEICCSVEST